MAKAGNPGPYKGRELEIATAIAQDLGKGIPMAKICRREGMPEPQTVIDWMARNPEIHTIIARARVEGFDVIAADCLDIADDDSKDSIETEHGEIPNSEWIARSKVRIETRLKLLAKWDPKRYGDAIAVQHSGEMHTTVTAISESQLSELREKKRRAMQSQRQPALNGNGKNGHN